MLFHEEVVAFLDSVLVTDELGFRRLGPRSWIYESARDKIVVLVDESWLTILHDGPHVVAGSVQLSVSPVGALEGEPGSDVRRRQLDNWFLQPILGRF